MSLVPASRIDERLDDLIDVADRNILGEQVLQHALHVRDVENGGDEFLDHAGLALPDTFEQQDHFRARQQQRRLAAQQLAQMRHQHRHRIDQRVARFPRPIGQIGIDPHRRQSESRVARLDAGQRGKRFPSRARRASSPDRSATRRGARRIARSRSRTRRARRRPGTAPRETRRRRLFHAGCAAPRCARSGPALSRAIADPPRGPAAPRSAAPALAGACSGSATGLSNSPCAVSAFFLRRAARKFAAAIMTTNTIGISACGQREQHEQRAEHDQRDLRHRGELPKTSVPSWRSRRRARDDDAGGDRDDQRRNLRRDAVADGEAG